MNTRGLQRPPAEKKKESPDVRGGWSCKRRAAQRMAFSTREHVQGANDHGQDKGDWKELQRFGKALLRFASVTVCGHAAIVTSPVGCVLRVKVTGVGICMENW